MQAIYFGWGSSDLWYAGTLCFLHCASRFVSVTTFIRPHVLFLTLRDVRNAVVYYVQEDSLCFDHVC